MSQSKGATLAAAVVGGGSGDAEDMAMKYEVTYQIVGTATFEAADAAEAQKKFDRLSLYTLAEIGDLTSDDPMRVEEEAMGSASAAYTTPTGSLSQLKVK